MTGPLTPEDPSQPLHHPGGDAEQAQKLVKRVLDWYKASLAGARAGGHDPAEVNAWRAARDQAVDDLDRLEDADEDETVQIALLYAARLKELTES
ncbi:hypothetical protein [Streptomyces atratus]|uniref:hypothetical protein n=1 Tax=Streptomyces atratus TaxID=1893 RepID=UPI0021A2CC91|nr:hypothetical protein [Streptomyces atratus]MCT2546223.1 hypothetical protein [Streptomyces atratus]